MTSAIPPRSAPVPAAGSTAGSTAGPSSTPDPTPTLRLDHFLKRSQLVGSGGGAKQVIQGGEVRVNGQPETRRKRKLREGDVVEFDGRSQTVGPITVADSADSADSAD